MRDQLLGGRYRLLRKIGDGGMGQVWEAEDGALGRRVAVKLISLLAGGGLDGFEARARFLREARITARLQHPNIVTVHDLGESGIGNERVPFLVMELVRGRGLDALLSEGAVGLRAAAGLGAQICDALAEAHRAGVLHRDIKPSNILITPAGSVKVLDFGVARAADPYATADRLTQTGFIVGTPPYMAPEQARGHPEPSSDLYALGCVLFELITGRLPFRAPDPMGYLAAHLTQEPPAPGSVSPGIPPAWDELVRTLLRKEPADRYPDASTLAEALRRLEHTPPADHPGLTGPAAPGDLVDSAAGPAAPEDRPHGQVTDEPPFSADELAARAVLLARLATAMRAAHSGAVAGFVDTVRRAQRERRGAAVEPAPATAAQPRPPRTPPLDAIPQRPFPGGAFAGARPPERISFSRGRLLSHEAGHRSRQGVSWGVVVGVIAAVTTGGGPIVDLGPLRLRLDDPTANRLLAGAIALALTTVIGLLVGVVRGVRAKADVVTVDQDGFSVVCRCRSARERKFVIRWSAVERIAFGGPSGEQGTGGEVRVRFRPGSEPTRAWLTKHDIQKRKDGTYSVYPRNHQPYVPATRLREPLRTFAGPRFTDPDHTPDPV